MSESSEYKDTRAGVFSGGTREFVKKPKLTFQVTEPRHGDDGWEVTATMDVVTELGEPVSGRVQFYQNGSPKEVPAPLDAEGRAPMRFVGLSVGKHLIEAKLIELPGVHGKKDVKVEFKVGVDVSETILGDDGMEATATAYVSAGDLPVKDIEGRFFFDEQPSGAPKRTGDDGRATQKFTNLSRGTHVLTFLVSSTTIRARKSFDVKEERVEAPTELLVGWAGQEGRYEFTITVLTSKGVGMRRRKVRIQDSADPKPIAAEVEETDELGVCTRSAEFRDRERTFTVSVLGTKLTRRVRLPGPSVAGAGTPAPPPTESLTPFQAGREAARRRSTKTREGSPCSD